MLCAVCVLCIHASELTAIFDCVDPALALTCGAAAPLRTDEGKSSDADKWARSGTHLPAGNSAVDPAAAKCT